MLGAIFAFAVLGLFAHRLGTRLTMLIVALAVVMTTLYYVFPRRLL